MTCAQVIPYAARAFPRPADEPLRFAVVFAEKMQFISTAGRHRGTARGAGRLDPKARVTDNPIDARGKFTKRRAADSGSSPGNTRATM
jgi:hypothetical protein